MLPILPQLTEIAEKTLIGMHTEMSLSQNKTTELWQRFMPRRKEIANAIGTDFISMQLYPPMYFEDFNPVRSFEKWACTETKDMTQIPDGMEAFTLPAGLYAVFRYKGLHTDRSIFQYIFGTWLPDSAYALDHRPHFELLGSMYKNNDPESEEDIYIPIKIK